MWINRFFEDDNSPKGIHIGLRMVKTVIAVFISGVLSYIRDVPPFFAMFSAVICLQNNAEESIISSLNRIMGTIMGALFGVALHYIAVYFNFYDYVILYYALVALMLIPIMIFHLAIKKPSIISLSCVIFISVALSVEPSVFMNGVQRVIDTTVGIITALIINILLPNHYGEDECGVPTHCEVPPPCIEQEQSPADDSGMADNDELTGEMCQQAVPDVEVLNEDTDEKTESSKAPEEDSGKE